MKIKAASLALLMMLVFNPAALAGRKPDRPFFFFLPNPVTFNGAEIPSGMYQLTLVTSNASVNVELWKNGKFVATACGTWVKSGVKFKDNAALLQINTDGSRSLAEFRLAGIARSIVLNDPVDSKVQANAK
ncbi:MAG TPA: hypothetical protein VKT71_09975 [Candidatus Acidoferrales bacterium]|nr:hypothetical protein [Candidatus Acidoferrales bacterium]